MECGGGEVDCSITVSQVLPLTIDGPNSKGAMLNEEKIASGRAGFYAQNLTFSHWALSVPEQATP